MEEEKKCPFCGHNLKLECEFMGEKVYRCSNCGSEMCFGNDMEWNLQEQKWNREESLCAEKKWI